MYEIFLIVYLIVALMLIGFVMIQHGKGADMGASFGAGASNTVFGSSGSGNFLTRTTAILAVIFFVLSLVLGNLAAGNGDAGSQFDDLDMMQEEVPTVPSNDSDVPGSN
ncbi:MULTISPECIES: preprotein translocase subunit SecG [Idiomarinaceae]|uniref:Protein-export membrane protein SecG n=3 Tax=Pseudidiomarina TaxID=2800384 RepID=A0A368V479_9GAMM|nr:MULTISPECIES: preprotein translocase subunit SecG [Idiomarinaceae]MDT7525188.1 preprotein translocase subunit SecG [Pseudidiomarina sp. GXY010]MDX1524734.1 preprotein translocase subunit SecG [Pseudidiomarina maritima]MRJ41051.1 preprotein translocase subunit SecG [Idiomarina sp. FeN1]NCU56216.1 preprotein translocase subunit SecG [Idiomarina sp. FenA--70]NCU59235.1 preprotein translocase subunit SecG [Idiomarina sp. FenBw--71]